VDPVTGVPLFRSLFIEQSFQQDALEVIQGIARANHMEEYVWEEVPYNNTTYLRLSPPPRDPEIVVVTYLSSGYSITALPDEARPAIEHAATYALINCVLNRVNSSPGIINEGARDRRYWLELVERQRDYYQGKYRAAIARRPRKGF
jgi:hypothetical protein